jgi:hypothetical protein
MLQVEECTEYLLRVKSAQGKAYKRHRMNETPSNHALMGYSLGSN